jgi:hypothetical protein
VIGGSFGAVIRSFFLFGDVSRFGPCVSGSRYKLATRLEWCVW